MNFKTGDSYRETKLITKDIVLKYAKLTGDFNSIHFDEEYASKTIFKKPIVHGPIVLIFVTTIFANSFPGNGCVYLGHNIKFIKPLYIDTEVTAHLVITNVNAKKHFFVQTICYNSLGEIIMEGDARLKMF